MHYQTSQDRLYRHIHYRNDDVLPYTSALLLKGRCCKAVMKSGDELTCVKLFLFLLRKYVKLDANEADYVSPAMSRSLLFIFYTAGCLFARLKGEIMSANSRLLKQQTEL